MQPRSDLDHPWDVSATEALAIQDRLTPRVIRGGDPGAVETVAGLDVARDGDSSLLVAAVVVMRAPAFQVVEAHVAVSEERFPYRPGFLAFSEGAASCAALAKLGARPDLLFVDGHGILHPRGLGLASHLGVLFDLPAVGCAKGPYVAQVVGEVGPEPGARADLVWRGEVLGKALRTVAGVGPLFVSVGHRLSLDRAVALVLDWTTRWRSPAPIREAHCLGRAVLRQHRETGAPVG